MISDKPNISDWIQYLISVRSINNTLMLAYISVMLGILSIIFLLYFNLGYMCEFIIITAVLFLIILIIAQYCWLAKCNREMSKKILYSIMLENITNTTDIRKKWEESLNPKYKEKIKKFWDGNKK